ncbi:MAG: 4Fe-4S dicluster domain-containing protein [Planctomycetes bacterium]|nr:4Fe-4S dicluster domain-containing protein [Planctomycetota bacterium]
MPDDSVTREIFGNIDELSKWIFYALTVASLGCFAYGVSLRVRLWRRGRAREHSFGWKIGITRFFKKVVWQKKVRRGRRNAGVAHLLLFGGFGVLFVGTLLIAIEHYSAALLGREPTDPLFHKGIYFAVFEIVLDTAGLALLVGCAWFVKRRLAGTSSIGQHKLDWLVLGLLLLLGVTGYLAEGLRIIREQTPQPGFSYVGLGVARGFEMIGVTRGNASTIHFALWWTHALFAFGLIAVFPYTRLLHSLAGAINLVTRTEQLGTLIPISIEEVEETGLVGAAALQDLTRQQLLELDACVSCGRCQDACPAYEAGKPLSPRDVVQDLKSQLSSQQFSKALSETVTDETVWSCTTCHACVDTCPLGVDPLRLITDLRRNLVAEGKLSGAPASSLQKMQRSGNPWGLPKDERMNWAEGLDVPHASDHPDFEVLYWVGCAAAYDRRTQKVARAVVKLLKAAEVNFAVLGAEECCTGESARRMGEEFLFQELAARNLETLARYSVRKIVTHCPHCLNSFKHDYPQFGGQFEVVHHTQFLANLVAQGKLEMNEDAGDDSGTLTYHDPCYLARVNKVIDPPRELIQLTVSATEANNVVELPRCGVDTACCGAGGGKMWFDDAAETRVGASRVTEAIDTGADTVVVSCPFCRIMMSDGIAARDTNVQVKDIAELLADAIHENSGRC